MKYGASGDEIRETVAIAVGVSAATIVDRSDLANFQMNISRLLDKADTLNNGRPKSEKPKVRKGSAKATVEE